jgi:hypothetical protein
MTTSLKAIIKEKLESSLFELDVELTTIYTNRTTALWTTLSDLIDSSNTNEEDKLELTELIDTILNYAHPTFEVALDNLFIFDDEE